MKFWRGQSQDRIDERVLRRVVQLINRDLQRSLTPDTVISGFEGHKVTVTETKPGEFTVTIVATGNDPREVATVHVRNGRGVNGVDWPKKRTYLPPFGRR